MPDKVHPISQSVPYGKSAEFICYSEEQVKWEFNFHVIPSNSLTEMLDTNKYSLELMHVTSESEGQYTCYGSEGNVYFLSHGQLTVLGNKLIIDYIIT